MTILRILTILFLAALLIGFMIWGRFTYPKEPKRHFITDTHGRKLIFHGMNVISAAKSDPLRVGGTTKEDFLDLSERWGFNSVRLLIFWDAIEPGKGEYDRAYMERVRQRLDWCEEAGLSVILDMHQDLYALRYGGDGAPDWAIIDDDKSFEHQTPWELNYIQPAVRASINNFWITSRGQGEELQNHFIDAMIFALDELGEHPALVGIDLYNEPTMVSLRGIVSFERRFLTPFLQTAINRIREDHPDLWLFFEPSALGPNQGFRTGLGRLDDPRTGEARLVYFPHIYTLDLDIKGRYAGRPYHIDFWTNRRTAEMKRFETPLMVGEFGLSEDKPGALDYLDEVLTRFDQVGSGWFYWSYDPGSWGIVTKDGKDTAKAALLSRPYPMKIAGEDPLFSWDSREKIFSLSYSTVPAGGKGDITEIRLPRDSFPDGWALEEGSSSVFTSWNEENRTLSLVPSTCGRQEIRIVSQ